MNDVTMQEVNRLPGAWRLLANEVRKLPPLPVTRWLAVQQGRLWLTRDGADEPKDIWLEAGDELRLEPGSSWWVEAWPQAQARLLEEPPRAQAPFSLRRAWSSLVAWMPAWRLV